MGVKHFPAGVPSVLSTPSMIGMMERTCVELSTPYMEENEQTVMYLASGEERFGGGKGDKSGA